MVRKYRTDKPIPPEIVEVILANALHAPSAGFSQGWGFLVLDQPGDIALFRQTATPAEHAERYFSATFEAPLVIMPCSNRDDYLDRYALPDKGITDRSTDWWPAPYWDIDTGFAALLMLLTVVDHDLGACFFCIPKETIPAMRIAFGIPAQFTPIGAITVGYADEPATDMRDWRRPAAQVVHRRHWRHAAIVANDQPG